MAGICRRTAVSWSSAKWRSVSISPGVTFRQVSKRIVLDIDDTFDATHGNQQLRLFNGFHDEYGFQPIVVFDGEGRFITAALRPAKRPKGAEILQYLRRLTGRIRENWPQVEILPCGDDHYCTPEVLDYCRAQGVDFILGLPQNKALRRHVTDLEASTFTRRSTAGAARPRTTSRPGRPTSQPTAPPARRPPPISSASSCTAAPTGSCGRCGRPCRSSRNGAARNSTPSVSG